MLRLCRFGERICASVQVVYQALAVVVGFVAVQALAQAVNVLVKSEHRQLKVVKEDWRCE